MENNHEQFPETIFDLIENKPFLSLESNEQKEVLAYVSEPEYNELHEAAIAIKLSQQAGNTLRHRPVKKELLQHFDQVHRGGSTGFSNMNILLKIAAVFLLFASGWLCHYLAAYRQNASPLVAEIDTVYITQEGKPIKIFDTVYIEEDRSGKEKKTKHQIPHEKMREKRDATEMVPGHINFLPSKHRDSSPLIPQMNDQSDDSLPRPGNS